MILSAPGRPAGLSRTGRLTSFRLLIRCLVWASALLHVFAVESFAAAPVLISVVPDITLYEGDSLQIIISAYDPDGDAFTYELRSAPAGATLADSIIRWNPNYAQAGVDTIIYRLEDINTEYVEDTVKITVLDAAVTYSDQAAALGLADSGITNAAAWSDYDGDGLTDVFVANGAYAGKLYKAGPGGAFTLDGAFNAVGVLGDASSAAWADYDRDGRPDLYVVNSGLFGGRVNRLYKNDSSGAFVDVTSASGTGNTGVGKCVAWADFDSDGDPDFYVVNYGGANELYSNNGNGTFTAMADTAGLADTGDGVAAAWGDYNLDGKPDLYLVNEHGANRLFKNDRDSTFTDVTSAAGVGHTGNGAAAAWGDYDGDGDFDLFLANKDSLQVLFSNNGDNTFTRLSSSAGLSVRGSARSAAWLDYDLDGRPDLMVAFADSANKLFRNLGDSTFTNMAPGLGLNALGYSSSVTWADPENQGTPDIYVGQRDGPNHYYPGLVQGTYLKVRLRGTISERFGIGARVRVRTGTRVQTVWIDGGGTSQSEPAALFGLGTAAVVDSLTVFWPAGLRRDTANVAVNQMLTWYETDSIFPVIVSTTDYPDTSFLTGPYPITSTVTDNNAITATLYYSTNRGSSYTLVSMSALGGDQYRGNIPGQTSGTRVFYYVRAVDAVGHVVLDPPLAPYSFFSFSVDDSVPVITSVTELPDTSDETGPYSVQTLVSENDSLRALYLVWSVYYQGVLTETDSAAMSLNSYTDSVETFQGQLAGRQIGNRIEYYVHAFDLAGNNTVYPATAPDTVYSFRVSLFSDKSDTTGVALEGQGMGVAVADYDRDGWPDVFMANLDTTDYLLKGSSSGVFSDVAEDVLGADVRATTAGVWGDFNNDGYPDLYLAVLGANALFVNDRDGTFTDISADAGVDDAGQAWAAAWIDYDNDGLLDLFVVNQDGADRLYHNQGDSSFADRAAQAGLAGASGGVGCCWADYDLDGDQDVYVAYYDNTNRLYRNNGNGTFTEVTGSAGVGDGDNTVSAAWFDYNNDGRLDIYMVGQADDLLFRSNTDSTFSSADMAALGFADTRGGFCVAWGDFDNDGYSDFFKSRGDIGQEDLNLFFRGKSDGTWEDYTFQTGTSGGGENRGAAWLDYDKDGRLDLIVNNRSQKARLFRNIHPGTNNHYLRVRLVGTRSNAGAVGALVTACFDGKKRVLRLGAGTSFASQSEPVLHFGLGSSSKVDTLQIRWPYGLTQTVVNITAGQELTITERDSIYPNIYYYSVVENLHRAGIRPQVSCRIADRDSLTTVYLRYRFSSQDTFITKAVVLDSVLKQDGTVYTLWSDSLPAAPDSTTVFWRLIAVNRVGARDSTALLQYSVYIDTLGPVISFINPPDSLLPDTIGPYTFRVRAVDRGRIGRCAFHLEGKTRAGDTVSVVRDSLFASFPDSLDWVLSVPASPLGSVLQYWALAVDSIGNADTTLTARLKVQPARGKGKLTNRSVNVADILRLTFIVLGYVEHPTLMDSLGYDLNGDNALTADDLIIMLNTLLVPNPIYLAQTDNGPESPSALARLEYQENGVAFCLDNSVPVPCGLVELALTENFDGALQVTPGPRLQGLVHAEGQARGSGSVILVFLAQNGSGDLAPGKGPLFTVSCDRMPQPGNDLPRLSIQRVYLGPVRVDLETSGESGSAPALPKSFSLEQNVPNPFNPSTTIRFSLPPDEHGGESLYRVKLTVYNLRGQQVCVLLDDDLPPGYHSVSWKGTDSSGKTMPSGIYFYRLKTPTTVHTRKMILLK